MDNRKSLATEKIRMEKTRLVSEFSGGPVYQMPDQLLSEEDIVQPSSLS